MVEKMNINTNSKYAVLFKEGSYEFDNRLHICYTEESGNKFSLAYFEKTGEGYDLRFVGGRPFKYAYDGGGDFMNFAKACFKYTEALDAFEEMVK
jgi:hypothetical protein